MLSTRGIIVPYTHFVTRLAFLIASRATLTFKQLSLGYAWLDLRTRLLGCLVHLVDTTSGVTYTYTYIYTVCASTRSNAPSARGTISDTCRSTNRLRNQLILSFFSSAMTASRYRDKSSSRYIYIYISRAALSRVLHHCELVPLDRVPACNFFFRARFEVKVKRRDEGDWISYYSDGCSNSSNRRCIIGVYSAYIIWGKIFKFLHRLRFIFGKWMYVFVWSDAISVREKNQ